LLFNYLNIVSFATFFYWREFDLKERIVKRI